VFGFNRLLWSKPSRIWSYGVAVLSTALALIIGRLMVLHLGIPPGVVFLCAVMLSAWYGGLGPALLATMLSAVAFYYCFLPPIYSWGSKPEGIPKLLTFLVSNLAIGLLSTAQRNVKESLRRALDDLERTVQDLQRTNDALHAESRERELIHEQLQRSEAYLAEAQRLTHTGSWACNLSTQEFIHSSEEHSRLYGFDPEGGTPSFGEFAQRLIQKIEPGSCKR